MIILEKITKAYPGQTAFVLENVTAQFEPGEVSVILGASGTGKTTLLNCILQLEMPDSGTVGIRTEPKADQSIPMTGVLQTPALFQHLTVIENLTIAPRNVLKKPPAQSALEARAMLTELGLAEKAQRFPQELSGGECQRIAIVRVLLMAPQVLVLDEPTNALNEEYIHQLTVLLRTHASQGMTIILSTHNLVFAHRVADRIWMLENGHLAESTHQKLARRIEKTHNIRQIQSSGKEKAVGC